MSPNARTIILHVLITFVIANSYQFHDANNGNRHINNMDRHIYDSMDDYFDNYDLETNKEKIKLKQKDAAMNMKLDKDEIELNKENKEMAKLKKEIKEEKEGKDITKENVLNTSDKEQLLHLIVLFQKVQSPIMLYPKALHMAPSFKIYSIMS